MFMTQNKALAIQPQGSSFYVISRLANIFCWNAWCRFCTPLDRILIVLHSLLREGFIFGFWCDTLMTSKHLIWNYFTQKLQYTRHIISLQGNSLGIFLTILEWKNAAKWLNYLILSMNYKTIPPLQKDWNQNDGFLYIFIIFYMVLFTCCFTNLST